jgi:dienelactone hydrolase
MHFFTAVFAWLVIGLACASGASAESYGAVGGEGASLRAQQWLVPSGDAAVAAHAILFRPAGDGPFRLAVIAHASTQNVLRRAQMPQPEYKPLAAFLVSRGFAVLVPERLGHGATGGPYLEDQAGCDEADYVRSGHATADEIAAALRFMRTQPFVQPDRAIVIGHSAGGWGALALSASDPREIAAIIAFAPGRGGHANDRDNEVCAPHTLLAAASAFGKAARVPVTWLVAANDSYFSPEFSRRLADAFRAAGGKVQFSVLPPYGSEGHWMAETEAGVRSAESALARGLKPDVAGRPEKNAAKKP